MLAITRVHSVFVIGGAAVFAVALGFVGKLSALILSIPGPVISGISFVLFGVIAASGLKVFKVGTFELSSMALATVLGIVLNLILPENARSEEQ